MAVTVRPGNQVVFVGDSITAAGWFSVTGGLVDQINAQIPTVVAPRYASLAPGASVASLASGARAATVASISTHNVNRTVNSGVPGNQTSDIVAAVASRITDYNPDVVVMLIGINDVTNAVALATIQANYDSILSQVRAWSGTVQIACVSVLWYGEQWVAGPAWSNVPSFDAQIDALNSAIQALCTTYSATYINARSPALVYETANNAPAPGVRTGILSSDGLHPNAAGQLQMGGWTVGSFTVSS